MSDETQITITLNKQALLHILRFIRGIYVVAHTEDGQSYDTEQCPYCLTILTSLQKSLDDIEIIERIHMLRVKAKMRQMKAGKAK